LGDFGATNSAYPSLISAQPLKDKTLQHNHGVDNIDGFDSISLLADSDLLLNAHTADCSLAGMSADSQSPRAAVAEAKRTAEYESVAVIRAYVNLSKLLLNARDMVRKMAPSSSASPEKPEIPANIVLIHSSLRTAERLANVINNAWIRILKQLQEANKKGISLVALMVSLDAAAHCFFYIHKCRGCVKKVLLSARDAVSSNEPLWGVLQAAQALVDALGGINAVDSLQRALHLLEIEAWSPNVKQVEDDEEHEAISTHSTRTPFPDDVDFIYNKSVNVRDGSSVPFTDEQHTESASKTGEH
jgi:hypothetical protein